MQMRIVLVAIVAGASMALAAEAIGQMQAPPPVGQRSPSPGSQSPTLRPGENSSGPSQEHQFLPNGAPRRTAPSLWRHQGRSLEAESSPRAQP